MATVTLTVRGMSCDGCEEIVEGALTDVSGVESATADRETESATVEGDADVDDLVEAVDFAGYEGEHGDEDAGADEESESSEDEDVEGADEGVESTGDEE